MRGLGLFAGLTLLGAAGYSQSQPDELFQAIRNNDLTYLKMRLAKGADVNTRDNRGNTLLMQAAGFGSPEAVQLLLDSGADANAKNALDGTALIWAATDRRKAAMLIGKGADVNARSKQGRTPLIVASTCDGCSDIVRMLLAKGADPKSKDSRGTSAVRMAASVDAESMRLLLHAGARPDGADGDGVTPLQAAAGSCDLDSVKLLLSKGADVNTSNTFAGKVKFGNIDMTQLTPLMLAAPFCSEAVSKTLLDAGAKVNERDNRGMTALMLAIASDAQNIGTVRLLIKAGADVNAKSKAGETALDWARKFQHPGILAALDAAGARPGEPFTLPQRPAAPAKSLMQAVEAGSSLLQRSSTEFFKQSGCVGCHHQPITVMAVSGARSHGAHVDDAADREHVKMMEAQWVGLQELVLERFDLGGGSDQELYSLLALGAARYPGNSITDSMAALVASYQARDGAWRRLSGISRPPAESGNIARTAFSIRTLQLYGSRGQRADFDERIARARTFLLQAEPVTNDDAAIRLAGLAWAGVDRNQLREAAQKLMAAQRADGGWAPARYLPSDAFATGQSLWALRESGMLSAKDEAYQSGVKYLLETQWQDGSWYVRSRSPKFQPYFQSGFPYNHDQWISSTATAWAVMALAPAVETSARPAYE
jgi:ankyrin repeat protein